MRILIVSHYALPHQGGIEIVAHQLKTRLGARGYAVTHLSSSIGSTKGITQVGNVTHIGLSALNALEKYAIPYPIFNPVELLTTLNRILPTIDVINVQGMLYLGNVAAAVLGHKRNIPVVVTEYPGAVTYQNALVNTLQKLAFNTLGRVCCQASDAATYINERVAQEWIKPFLRPHAKLVKIPIGVDTQAFVPATPAQKATLRQKWGFRKPTVLFVGRLVYRKGIDLLPQIACDDFDVVVCGHGTLMDTHPKLRVVGGVSQQELIELYQASDVFVLLTDGEDFPLVGLEALSSGLPVIAIDTPANREYLNDTVARFVKRDAAAIAAAIGALIEESQPLQQMGNAAREYAVVYYDWERTIDQYVALFNQLLKS